MSRSRSRFKPARRLVRMTSRVLEAREEPGHPFAAKTDFCQTGISLRARWRCCQEQKMCSDMATRTLCWIGASLVVRENFGGDDRSVELCFRDRMERRR